MLGGFFSRMFGRKSTPPQDRRGWTEDWQVGDLALCIGHDWIEPMPADPKRGDCLRVSGLAEGPRSDGKYLISALSFEGKPSNLFWSNTNFCKIRPAEEAFTEAMRRLRDNPAHNTPAPSEAA